MLCSVPGARHRMEPLHAFSTFCMWSPAESGVAGAPKISWIHKCSMQSYSPATNPVLPTNSKSENTPETSSDCTLCGYDMALNVMQLHAHSPVPHLITFPSSVSLYIQTTDNQQARKNIPTCSSCILQQQR